MVEAFFFSFEGGEGSGKTTQARLLYQSLISAGQRAVLVHEPGSTSLGDHLRRYLKEKHPSLSKKAELLLFTAARAQLVEETIIPSLQEGLHVIADRYMDSTVAYQGYGRGLDMEAVHWVNDLAVQGVIPRLTFLLDIEPTEGLHRTGNPQLCLPLEASNTQGPGRLEEEGQRGFENLPLQFHRRVRSGYLEMAKKEQQRWIVLDASLPTEELAAQVLSRVNELLSGEG